MKYKRKFEKLSETRRKDIVANIVELKKEGKSNKVIIDHLLEKTHGKVSRNMLENLTKEADLFIQNEHIQEVNLVVSIHTQRYNQAITDLLKVEELSQDDIVSSDGKMIVSEDGTISEKQGITYQQWQASRDRKIKAYDEALNTMQQKENLLQLVNLDLEIDINEKIDINIKSEKPKYDFSLLTFEERVELMELCDEAAMDHDEIMGTIEVIDEKPEETVDVEVEILPANVEQIKQVEPEGEKESVVTHFDLKLKLREKLKVIAAKKLKDAGANLDDQEQSLL